MSFIIGCDFHPSYQQIAILDVQTGEVVENKSLGHENEEEVREFYAGLPGPVRVGVMQILRRAPCDPNRVAKPARSA